MRLREESAQGRVVGILEQRLQLVQTLAQQEDLAFVEPQADAAVRIALDLPGRNT